MTVTNLSINEDQRNATTGEITDDHFGANLVSTYEAFGTETYQDADDIIETVGITSLRWPGGVDAERLGFGGPDDGYLTEYTTSTTDGGDDIFPLNPTANDDNENIRNPTGMTSLREAMTYCTADENDMSISVIIPTAPFAIESGDRSGLEDYIRAIFQIALDTGADLTALEIGNEYWDLGISSAEYGVIAAEISTVIARVANDYDTIDPDVLIQVWGQLGNSEVDFPRDEDALSNRNGNQLEAFLEEGGGDLENIDGVVSHYYFADGRVAATGNEQPLGYHDINERVAFMVSLGDIWAGEDDDENDDFQFVVSEWNIAPNATGGALPNWGLAQIAPVLEIFTAMLENGVDAAQFWSMLNHSYSLGRNAGSEVNLIGDFMQDFIARVSPSDPDDSYRYVELGVTNNVYDVHYFLNDTSHEGLLYLSSLTDGTLDHALNLNGLYVIASSVSISIIGSDGVTADYEINDVTYVDLPGYRQPEATMTIDGYNGTLSNIRLDAYEIAVVTFDTYDVIATVSETYNDTTYGVSYKYDDELDTNDHITGTTGHDWIRTGKGQDYIHGGAANDALYSGAGNDIVYAGAGDDYVAGGGGNDVLNGGDGADKIYGGTGNDEIYGGNQYDVIDAGSGNDRVWGGNGSDTVDLGTGSDIFYDNAQNDANGHDTVRGGAGNDTINGGGGNDIFSGDDGNDFISGGVGNDTLDGGNGDDQIYGGTGDDGIDGGNQHDVIDAGSGNDRVWGGNGRDTVDLGTGSDIFYDNAQNDANGGDIVDGGAGNDEIYIGGGNDRLTGGSGEDRFIFTSSADGRNVITDFELEIDTLEFTGVTLADLSYVSTGSGVRVEWDGNFVKLDGVNINDVDSIDFVFS